MAATILPRPIAWVSTLNEDGSANLAPFSFFTGVGSDPPTCLICVSRKSRVEVGAEEGHLGQHRAHGRVRHPRRARRARARHERDVEGVPARHRRVRGRGRSRRRRPSGSAPPRVAEAPVAMECRLHQIVEVGAPATGTAIIIGEILLWHVRDERARRGAHRLRAARRRGAPGRRRLRAHARPLRHATARNRRAVGAPRVVK